MIPKAEDKLLNADRVWIATALLHREHPERSDFSKDEIRDSLAAHDLSGKANEATLNNHLDQHCVANVPPSSGKYRMLFEPLPGRLRLFRPGDLTHPARIQKRKPSKSAPNRDEIPRNYWHLLDWYESWSKAERPADSSIAWEDDPLIRLIGSGKEIWADEHADEYVENLRREDI